MRLLYWALVAMGAVLVALFAVSNRGAVALGLWPLPFVAELPAYLLVLVPLAFGFLLGRGAGWLAGHGRRREMRRRARRIAALERELAATQALLDERGEKPAERLPATG
jgi:putative membrane protein